MNNFFTIIVPASIVIQVRELARSLSPEHCSNMFITPLVPIGSITPTHYVSTGLATELFSQLIPKVSWGLDENNDWVIENSFPGNLNQLYELTQQVDLPVSMTLEDLQNLAAAVDSSDQEPFTAFARLGLEIYSPADGNIT